MDPKVGTAFCHNVFLNHPSAPTEDPRPPSYTKTISKSKTMLYLICPLR